MEYPTTDTNIRVLAEGQTGGTRFRYESATAPTGSVARRAEGENYPTPVQIKSTHVGARLQDVRTTLQDGTGQFRSGFAPCAVRESLRRLTDEAFYQATRLRELTNPIALDEAFNTCLNRVYELLRYKEHRERNFLKALLLIIGALDELEGDELNSDQRKAVVNVIGKLRVPKLSDVDLRDMRREFLDASIDPTGFISCRTE